MAFRRLLFYADSPETPWPSGASEYTAFAVQYKAAKGLDLAAPPLDRDKPKWTHPTNYGPCQALAGAARDAGVQALRYESARTSGQNIALLTCAAFASRKPVAQQVWRMHLGPSGARATTSTSSSAAAWRRSSATCTTRPAISSSAPEGTAGAAERRAPTRVSQSAVRRRRGRRATERHRVAQPMLG